MMPVPARFASSAIRRLWAICGFNTAARMTFRRGQADGRKEKRAMEFPPEFSTRDFLNASRLRPMRFDFPPEIKRLVVA
jgi:hypothetical protein